MLEIQEAVEVAAAVNNLRKMTISNYMNRKSMNSMPSMLSRIGLRPDNKIIVVMVANPQLLQIHSS